MSENASEPRPIKQLVKYRHSNPSPSFTKFQLEYIEAVGSFLSPDELDVVRSVEQIILDLATGEAQCDFIPGLRQSSGKIVYYVRRFSSDNFMDMINKLLDLVIFEELGRAIRRTAISPFRFTLENGDRYYPVILIDAIKALRPELLASAARLNAKTAELDHGKFVLSDGEIISLSAITIDRAERDYPEGW